MGKIAQLSFWGAAGTVTGSKYLLETAQSRILIDCGLFQGGKELREKNWEDPTYDPVSIDAVVLTHAHTDHVGYLPRLVKHGFRGPIYCTRATMELARIILEDGAELQEEEADWRNKKGLSRHQPALPLYDRNDVRRTVRLFKPQSGNSNSFNPMPDIRVQWWPAGHMLGARSLRLEIDNAGENGETRSIVFSGDIGRWNQPVLRDPVTPPPADYVVVESTYGDRRHEEEEPQEQLAQVIREAHANNSPVLIPAFSVGRTQDVLYHIRELEDQGRIPIVPVRADSPMAAEATRVYHQMGEEYDEEMKEVTAEHRNPLVTRSMQFTSSREDSRRLNAETGARIIISSSGMMTGGRVMHHASQLLPDPNAVICFVGYQSEGTTGRRIVDGETEVRLFKQWVPVRAKIVKIGGFSGHADCLELLGWLSPLDRQAPKRAFVTHGEPHAAAALAAQISDRFGWEVTVAAHGQTVELR